MTEGLAFEPEDEPGWQLLRHPAGWQVLDRDGTVVAAGGQAMTEASAGAGEE